MSDKDTRFKPGQSGNPSGRPKGIAEVQRLAREYTEAAIHALADIIENGQSEAARISAAVAILDRGYGKPVQPIDGDGQGGPVPLNVKITFVRPGEAA